MARPFKEGLDYFPVDVDIDGDDKLVVVIGKFGTLGFGIVVRLMMEIYKNGYFYNWTEREQYAFSNRINVDINTVSHVVTECIKWGFFHQKLFEEHTVLTSHGFQKRYLMAISRRVNNEILPEYNLIPADDSTKKVAVSADIKPVIADIVDTLSTQSKKKVNKSKVNKKSKPIKLKYAEFVSLTEVEHNKLVSDFGIDFVTDCIDVLNSYKGSSGKTYKSDYMTMTKNGWVYKRVEEDRAKTKKQSNGSSGKPKLSIIPVNKEDALATDDELQQMLLKANRLKVQPKKDRLEEWEIKMKSGDSDMEIEDLFIDPHPELPDTKYYSILLKTICKLEHETYIILQKRLWSMRDSGMMLSRESDGFKFVMSPNSAFEDEQFFKEMKTKYLAPYAKEISWLLKQIETQEDVT